MGPSRAVAGPYRVEWSGPAARRMDHLARSHPKVTAAVVEFVYGPLATDPIRVGKALRGQLAGLRSARRGDYRILYRVEADAIVVEAVGHRGAVYRGG
ncbi:MAG: type II toxin-antitoxin system RelE family toxin [Acidimicrobiales bacterium]